MHKKYYKQAADEFEDDKIDAALMAKATAEAQHPSEIIGLYFRLRARELQAHDITSKVTRTVQGKIMAAREPMSQQTKGLLILGFLLTLLIAVLWEDFARNEHRSSVAPTADLSYAPVGSPTAAADWRERTASQAPKPVSQQALSNDHQVAPNPKTAAEMPFYALPLGKVIAAAFAPEAGDDAWSLSGLPLSSNNHILDDPASITDCTADRCAAGELVVWVGKSPITAQIPGLAQYWGFQLQGDRGTRTPTGAYFFYRCYNDDCDFALDKELQGAAFQVSRLCLETGSKGDVIAYSATRGSVHLVVSHAIFNATKPRTDFVFVRVGDPADLRGIMCNAPGNE